MNFYRLAFASALIACASLVAEAAPVYVEPTDTSTVDVSGWDTAPDAALIAGWVSKNPHYRQRVYVPGVARRDTVVSAWRGERIGLEALLESKTGCGPLSLRFAALTDSRGNAVDAPGSSASFMRFVTTTHWNACGYPSDTLPTFTVPDMIDLPDAEVSVPARTVRPVWCTVEVPRDIAPGAYTARLEVCDAGDGRVLDTLTARIEVNARQLPAPHDYAFYLDLWQQPYAIARYYGVKPWSEEHLRLLEPYADMLARAGQKTVSAILFYEPWGEQSHDKFEPMVETTLMPDGSWKYDYTIFDRWVEFMDSRGIDANISCFTMIPWEMKFRYFDKAKGAFDFLEAKSDSPEYKALWTDFLQALASHLRAKGWYDKTYIVMDERGLQDMLNAYRVAQEAVPGIRMSLAGSYHPELVNDLESYTLIKGDFFPASVMKSRRDKGYLTLMYTCCATPAPSQFSNSAPADGAYLPVYSTATGHDGYLHWSFMNWTDNPLADSRFRMFAPGDTFFVYPDGRSSIRYERMLEGIQMSEKLRLLRREITAAGDMERMQALEQALLPVRTGAMNSWTPTSQIVDDLQRDIETLSR